MDFKKVAITTTVLFSLTQAASFQKLHDICDTTDTQKCPNITNEITLLQKFLNIGAKQKLTVNGKWNKATKLAVINFQKEHNLPANGYIGTMTKNSLDLELKNKLAQLKKPKNKHTTVAKSVKKENKIAKKVDNKSKTLAKIENKKPTTQKVNLKKIHSYEAFKRSINLRKSFAVYKDSKLLKRAGGRGTLVKVDVSEQRVKLVVNGKVALSAPCTTGAKHKLEPNTRTYRDKHTPLGTFKILEKIATKRSTIFGNFYRHGKLIYHGDRRKFRGSHKGLKFVGAPLYNWMRLTSSGIGLHASNHVKRYPGSNGCIRLPKSVASTLFSKLKKGTVVKVVN